MPIHVENIPQVVAAIILASTVVMLLPNVVKVWLEVVKLYLEVQEKLEDDDDS